MPRGLCQGAFSLRRSSAKTSHHGRRPPVQPHACQRGGGPHGPPHVRVGGRASALREAPGVALHWSRLRLNAHAATAVFNALQGRREAQPAAAGGRVRGAAAGGQSPGGACGRQRPGAAARGARASSSSQGPQGRRLPKRRGPAQGRPLCRLLPTGWSSTPGRGLGGHELLSLCTSDGNPSDSPVLLCPALHPHQPALRQWPLQQLDCLPRFQLPDYLGPLRRPRAVERRGVQALVGGGPRPNVVGGLGDPAHRIVAQSPTLQSNLGGVGLLLGAIQDLQSLAILELPHNLRLARKRGEGLLQRHLSQHGEVFGGCVGVDSPSIALDGYPPQLVILQGLAVHSGDASPLINHRLSHREEHLPLLQFSNHIAGLDVLIIRHGD
mmetsp:Transcript_42908/g.128198  ORF Transcript_42908/g.128198 Transcript_42908/m.128198 type:complete len:382 (-) Transcript_42908:1339-2484(-)